MPKRPAANSLKSRKGSGVSLLFDVVDEGPTTDIAAFKDKMVGEAIWREFSKEVFRNHQRNS
jgi:hypothetical protein